MFVFNVPPTAKVVWGRGHSLKSHLRLEKQGSNPHSLIYKASGLSTTPQQLHNRVTLKTPNIVHLSILTSVGYNKKVTNLKKLWKGQIK